MSAPDRCTCMHCHLKSHTSLFLTRWYLCVSHLQMGQRLSILTATVGRDSLFFILSMRLFFFVYRLCMDSCKSKWIRLQKDHTTFANPHGHFAFTRQPFGLRSLPITFSGLISLIMQGLIGDVAFHLLRSLIASKNIPEPRRRKLENKCQKMSILLQTLIQACDLPSQERHSVHMDW